MTSRGLTEEAVRLGEEIWARRVETPKKELTWLGPHGYGTERYPLRMVPVGAHLYHGTPGIALFLAALYKVTGDDIHKERARTAIQPLRRVLAKLAKDPERAAELDIPVGGLIGAGSFCYSLLVIGECLGEPEMLVDARRAASLITVDRIERDHRPRVQTGCAGAILALLALHEKTPESNGESPSLLESAEACGRHLVQTRVRFEDRPRAWALSPGKPPLAGYSYGAAGIVHALSRLHEYVPAKEFREAADEGLSFIDQLFDEDRGAWHDVRELFKVRSGSLSADQWKDWWASPDTEVDGAEGLGDRAEGRPEGDQPIPGEPFPKSWCHGASGIVLSLLGSPDRGEAPRMDDRIRASVATLEAAADRDELHPEAADDVCCGYMGWVEPLLVAAKELDRPELKTSAISLAEVVMERASRRGGYTLTAARGSDHFAPTLFQGAAGIGYTLLRLEAPEQLPCILLFH